MPVEHENGIRADAIWINRVSDINIAVTIHGQTVGVSPHNVWGRGQPVMVDFVRMLSTSGYEPLLRQLVQRWKERCCRHRHAGFQERAPRQLHENSLAEVPQSAFVDCALEIRFCSE